MVARMQKFVILSYGRCASTLLCRALSEHPRIQAYHEVLGNKIGLRPLVKGRRCTLEDRADRFCEETIWSDPPAGKDVAGFKLFHFHAWENAEQRTIWTHLQHRSDILKIILKRENLFERFLSSQRMLGTGIIQPPGKNLEEAKQKYNSARRLDVKACMANMNSSYAGMAWVTDTFGAGAMILSYEQLKGDLQGTLNAAHRFLGVEEFPSTMRITEFGDKPGPDNISNWAQVVKHFDRTRYRAYFEDYAKPV
ncbi:hypothetical protein BH10PSE7_BH10PSE7_21190 [soil metagenome]